MNLATWDEAKWQDQKAKATSGQHERLQARAGGYLEAPRGERQGADSDGLIADKDGDEQISTATRILAEVIASDASWLMVFNSTIDHIIQTNPKAK